MNSIPGCRTNGIKAAHILAFLRGYFKHTTLSACKNP
jgi:hypothetical protein